MIQPNRKKVGSIHWFSSGNIGINRYWLDEDNEFHSRFEIYDDPTPASRTRLASVVQQMSYKHLIDSVLPSTGPDSGWLLFTTRSYYKGEPQ